MVLKGPSNATDLKVLQGKAYEKTLLTSIHSRPVCPEGTELQHQMNLTPFVYLHMYTLPSSGAEVLRSYNIHR